MVQLPSDISDGLLTAAILQSDEVVRIVQRELNQVYPTLNLNQTQVLELLRRDVIRDTLLDESKLQVAADLLVQAKAATLEKRTTGSRGTFKAVPSKEAEEEAHEMWHDKTMASGGGGRSGGEKKGQAVMTCPF